MIARAGRRICVVSYYYPPSTPVGGIRWAAMATHLRDMGHEVTVVASAIHGAPPDELVSEVIRTADLGASTLLRRGLRRPKLPVLGAAPVITPAPGLLTRVVVPDSYLISWVPSAWLAVRRLLQAGRIDTLITSGPPHSIHLIGLTLLLGNSSWIVDLRDGWLFEPQNEPWPTGIQRRIDARLERLVAQRADAVIGGTAPIADDVAARLGVSAEWVPSGWDPVREAEVGKGVVPPAAAPEPGWVTLAHTGTLSGGWGRDPRPILDALGRHNQDPQGGARVRLILAGQLTVEDVALLEAADLGEDVRHLGLLDRPSALALQRSADALLLVTSDNVGEATGKIFEYLVSGRPIIALARGNEAARIIGMTGTGLSVSRDDAEAVSGALQQLADGSLSEHYAPHDLEQFRQPVPAAAVSRIIEGLKA